MYLDNRKRYYWVSIPNSILALVDAITLDHFDKAQEEFEKKEQNDPLTYFCDKIYWTTLTQTLQPVKSLPYVNKKPLFSFLLIF